MNKEQKDFHKSRRKEFSKLIGQDSLAIIFGSTHYNKSYDENFNFKQYKNFYYLTGFTEPDSALLIAPNGISVKINDKEKSIKEALYVQPKDPLMETWNGRRLGDSNIKPELGIEYGIVNEQLRSVLSSSFQSFRRLYINISEMLNLSGEMKNIITPFLNSLNHIAPNIEIIDPAFILGKLRSVKTPFEINLIRKACKNSINSYNKTLKMIGPGVAEYQVQASLEYNYLFNEGGENAYYPVVAGGENACILHYDTNDQILRNGDLVLIDSGAEYKYYCSDITRTFPVNGKFTKEQKTIYEIVLKANKECIKRTKPGIKFSALRDLSDKVLADGLFSAGILRDKKDIKTYSLHGVGHHIGLDTHDAVPYNKIPNEDNDTLQPGNVLTIEPGLYFPVDSKKIAKEYKGIGVRIEDDVLVTKNGCENLTAAMAKEVREIEELMSSTD